MAGQKRTRALNDQPIQDGRYVLCWMQAAQRSEYNHALEYAIALANRRGKAVLGVFALTDNYPEANLRHYHLMLEGLSETKSSLAKRGIQLAVIRGEPDNVIVDAAVDADAVIVDAGQLRMQRKWRANAAEKIGCAMYEVETNLIIPVWEASGKEEFAARTIRPKIHCLLSEYLTPVRHRKVKVESLGLKFKSFDISDPAKAASKLKIDTSVKPVSGFTGGTSHAKKRLRNFIKIKLDNYDKLRNDPGLDYQSGLSPYLHFGQISPLFIAIEVLNSNSKGKDAFLEELIVRRELSHNYVYYSDRYDSIDGIEPWSKRTLNFHERDKREYIYTLEEFEHAGTHDKYWNAAQMEMALTGKMHGYMRMYWGKKILEWSKSLAEAFNTAIYLNNKYELDGRDANGYSGVAWCFGKHDRAWPERKVFGKIRYMNAAGLKRKFDIDAYIRKVEKLTAKL